MYRYTNISSARKVFAALALLAFMLATACSGDYEAKAKPDSELKAKLVYYALPG